MTAFTTPYACMEITGISELLPSKTPELQQTKAGTESELHSRKKPKGLQLPSKTPVKCMAEHQDILERLVGMLEKPPVLAYPDFNLYFTLHTDTSEEGLGTILYQ